MGARRCINNLVPCTCRCKSWRSSSSVVCNRWRLGHCSIIMDVTKSIDSIRLSDDGTVLVNVTASHLFDPFTPGVLSLFAILYLLAPIWIRISRNNIAFGTTLVLIGIISTVFSPGDSSLSWNDRIEVDNNHQFLSHLLVTGTYPLFPWMFFSILVQVSTYMLQQSKDLSSDRIRTVSLHIVSL